MPEQVDAMTQWLQVMGDCDAAAMNDASANTEASGELPQLPDGEATLKVTGVSVGKFKSKRNQKTWPILRLQQEAVTCPGDPSLVGKRVADKSFFLEPYPDKDHPGKMRIPSIGSLKGIFKKLTGSDAPDDTNAIVAGVMQYIVGTSWETKTKTNKDDYAETYYNKIVTAS